MRLIRLYQANIEGEQITLDERNHHHLAKVLRAKPGQPVELFDGFGAWRRGELSLNSTKKRSIIQVSSRGAGTNEPPIQFELILSLSKNQHFEYALQKAVELGVTMIRPVITERSELKLKPDRLEKKHQSWLGTIISACEQSYRCTLPQLQPLTTLQEAAKSSRAEHRFVLDHRSAKPIAGNLTAGHCAVIVGPEGGLSEQDLAVANEHHFTPTAMGPRVLRTETAPIAALSILGYLYGDLGLSRS